MITVHGVPDLGCADYRVIPDRIEAGTYVIAAAATGGQVQLLNVIPHHLEPLLRILTAMGVPIEVEEGIVRVYPAEELSPAQIQTAPYPGFPRTCSRSSRPFLSRLGDRALCGNRFTTTVSDTSGNLARWGRISLSAKIGPWLTEAVRCGAQALSRET